MSKLNHTSMFCLPALCALLALGVVACDEDEPEAMVTVTNHVFDIMDDSPVEGASVCVLDRADLDCATVDAAGFLSMEVPANTSMMLQVTADDYWPALTYYTSTDADEDIVGHFSMVTELEGDMLLGLVGEVPDDTKGNLVINMFDSENTTDASFVAGVTVTLESAAGGVRLYVDENGDPDTDLTESTNVGFGAFANAAAGTWNVTTSHAAATCTMLLGRGDMPDDTFEARIEPGHITVLYLLCQ